MAPKRRRHPIARPKPVGGATRKADGVHRVDQDVGVQKVCLPGPRPAATNITCSGGARVRDDHCNAGAHGRILRLTDLQPWHVGD